MSLLKNYYQDLKKSQSSPLLIELSKKDLDLLCKDEVCGVNVSLALSKEVYDSSLENTTETNLIYIDGNNTSNIEQTYLLEEILNLLEDHIKNIRNLDIVKTTITQTLAAVTGGTISEYIGDIVNDGVDSIIGDFQEDILDTLVQGTLDVIDPSGELGGILEGKAFDFISDNSIDFIDTLKRKKLYLSVDSKEYIKELIEHLKAEMTPAESFRFIIELLVAVAINSPTLLYIKDPHKLDRDSLAILSLLLSFSKDMKDHEKHTGISVVYTYEDESFQPYQEVKEEYKQSKELLDEQRLFAQRYAILERPTSDIPHIAVKSSMFVGRQEELANLNARYDYSKEYEEIATLQTISGEPGVGKTKLVKKHLEMIRKKNGAKLIQLSLLNSVGHSSVNTGLGSLTNSILKEVKRLEALKSFKEKVVDGAAEWAIGKVFGMVKSTLGVDAVIEISESVSDRVFTEGQIERTKLNTIGDLDNKQADKKQEQFTKLTTVIKQLQELSDKEKPIILFVDDLQWIDEESAEYIIEHFTKKFNVHIVATIRPSDATTMLKKAYDNQDFNLYKIAFLNKAKIIIHDDNQQEINLVSDIDISRLEHQAIHLKGLNSQILQELITQVIQGDEGHQAILTKTIIKELNNHEKKDEVNTLFAVETINMLCDAKLYTTQDKEIEQLILTDMPLRFNPDISDFQASLDDTFKLLNEKYKKAFEHINAEDNEAAFKQKFNLMAYAVLEERLNILKIYFGNYGNAAVNTLLFSSLLGTPFNSKIVENVLEAIKNTKEKSLQPLKEYILEGKKEITLTEAHYEIIEEVYEILSRYIAYDNSYAYRHSLLNIFLYKQLDYILDVNIKNNTAEAKDKLYLLILDEIKKEKKKKKFYNKNDLSLNAKEYESMLFYAKTEQNILERGYKHNPLVWAGKYIDSINTLAYSYYKSNQIKDAIELQEEAFIIIKKLYNKDKLQWTEHYIASLNNLAYIYKDTHLIHKALILEKEGYLIGKNRYYKDEDNKDYAYIYTILADNLANTYRIVGDIEESIKIHEENLIFRRERYLLDNNKWAELYTESLANMSTSYNQVKRFGDSIVLLEERLKISCELYDKDLSNWTENYVVSLGAIASCYHSLKENTKSISLYKKQIDIVKGLYDSNQDVWINYYTIALNGISSVYHSENNPNKATEYISIAISLYEKIYNDQEEYAKHYKTLLYHLFIIKFQNDNYSEAMTLSKEIIKICETFYKKYPNYWIEEYIDALNSISRLYESIEPDNNILLFMENNIKVLTTFYIDDPESFADVYNSILRTIVKIQSDLNKIDNAIVLLEENLIIVESLYKKDTNKWAMLFTSNLNNVAYLYKKIDKFQEAMDLEKRSYKLLKNLYKEDSKWALAYTVVQNNLASSYGHKKDTQKMLELKEENLKIFSIEFEKDPEYWGKTYSLALNELAGFYFKNNLFNESIQKEEINLEILTTLLSKDSDKWQKDYFTSINNLSHAYEKFKSEQVLKSHFNKNLMIVKQYYKQKQNQWFEIYTRLLENLASINYKLNDFEEALALFLELYIIFEESFGQENENTKRIHNLITMSKFKIGNIGISATFTDLLYSAKFIASFEGNNKIEIMHLLNALQFIELNNKAKHIFSQILDLKQLNKFENAQQYIDKAKSLPKIMYTDEAKLLIEQLEDEFGNEPIGMLR